MTIIDRKNIKLFQEGVSALRNNICVVLTNPDETKRSEAFLGTSTAPALLSDKQLDKSREMKSELGEVLDNKTSNDSKKTL